MALCKRSVGIVGVGHVGAHVANALALQGVADELVLCDVKEAKAVAEDQDLRDTLSFCPHNVAIRAVGDAYEELAGCDVVVNAAGDVSLIGVTRDAESVFSPAQAALFAPRIAKAGFSGIWVSIANPCDVVATVTQADAGFDPARVIGTGTALDSARLKTALARAVHADPHAVSAYMVGEHGDHQVAVWSHATVGGVSLDELAAADPERFTFDRDAVEHQARRNAYVTYAGKGCTEYAIAAAASRLVSALFNDEQTVLPCSSLLTGQYGESGIYASLPCLVGRNGVEKVLEPKLDEREEAGFHEACAAIRRNLATFRASQGA
jgi:L-lactate dehydrogenase